MLKKKIIIIFILLLAILAVIVPLDSSAAGIVPCGGDGEPQCTLCHLVIGIKNIIDYGFKILVFVALAAITISGVMYVVSSGSEELMKKAKDFIKQTLYGFAIVLGGWLIINYAMVLLGAKDSNGDGVPDFGFVATGKWSEFTCDATPIPPGGAPIPRPGGMPPYTGNVTCDGNCFPKSSCAEVSDSRGYKNYIPGTGNCSGDNFICCTQPEPAAYSCAWKCPSPLKIFEGDKIASCSECNTKGMAACDKECSVPCEPSKLCTPVWDEKDKIGTCGEGGKGLCFSGSISCPDGKSRLFGGGNCSSGMVCCIDYGKEGDVCGPDDSGICKAAKTNTSECPSGLSQANGIQCGAGLNCCKK